MRRLACSFGPLAVLFLSLTTAGMVRAEPAAVPATAPAPAAAPIAVAAAPAPADPPPPAPPPPAAAPVASPPPPPPAEPPPEKLAEMTNKPPPAPIIAYNIGVRVGARLQDPFKPKDMTQVHNDQLYTELRFHGDLTDMFGWVANFNAAIGNSNGTMANQFATNNSPDVAPMDMILKFHAAKEFNIWGGRLLVPSDRSNFTGPFFMSPWNYPGNYPGHFVGPNTGPNGRDQGATVWGNALDDKFKYYGGVYGIDSCVFGTCPAGAPPGGERAYYSGRLSYSFQGTEPGYFGSSTYYGDKSVVTVGLSGQYQKGASIDNTTGKPTDTATLMADVLAEEVVPGTGTFTVEAQGYLFNPGASGPNSGNGGTPKEAFYILGSYLTENVGIGKIQPLIRWQQTANPSWTVVDAQLAYVIKAYFLKFLVNYQYGVANGVTSNMIQLGGQMQM